MSHTIDRNFVMYLEQAAKQLSRVAWAAHEVVRDIPSKPNNGEQVVPAVLLPTDLARIIPINAVGFQE